MLEFSEALALAQNYYAQTGRMVIKALQFSQGWLFYGGIDERPAFGGNGILISKEDGSIKDFILPSSENFAILKEAKPIEFKEEI